MGKKKNKKEYDGKKYVDSSDIVARVTEALNKKGRISKGSKKEVRMLRYACPHHMFDKKKGKVVPTLGKSGGGNGKMLYCNACKASFTGQILTDKEVDNGMRKAQDIVQQLKFLIHAAGGSQEDVRYVTNAAVAIYQLPGVYKKARKIVEKKQKLGKKDKRNTKKQSNQFGAWQ